MFVVLLDVVGDGASYLHLREQVEVSEDEERLTVLLEVLPGHFLINKQVLVVVAVQLGLVLCAIAVLHVVVGLEVAVAVREDVVLQLHHQQWEVYLRQLVVQQTKAVVFVRNGGGLALPQSALLILSAINLFCQRGLLSLLI